MQVVNDEKKMILIVLFPSTKENNLQLQDMRDYTQALQPRRQLLQSCRPSTLHPFLQRENKDIRSGISSPAVESPSMKHLLTLSREQGLFKEQFYVHPLLSSVAL